MATPADRAAAMSGFGGRAGRGERPALLVVDMTRGFTDPAGPLACDAAAAVTATAELLACARAYEVPVLFTAVAYSADAHLGPAGVFLEKVPALRQLLLGSEWIEIDPRISPKVGETVLVKQFASAFFATDLLDRLRSADADSLLVTGVSTSGCVRATVVDAMQHGLRAVVAAEAVADRSSSAHQQALIDIDSRYGDVVNLDEALAWMSSQAATGSDVRSPG